ncbi:hypothetical protein P691DRAFT_660928, partial [Macrolepiota fuliginosa MF-IS2]
TITEEQLWARFAPCGPLLRIVVRCSRGQAINVLSEDFGWPFGPRDRKYATVEFSDSKAYLKALQLNGQLLDGAPMVVSTSPTDLPEAKELPCRTSDAPVQSSRIPQIPVNMPAINSINSPHR